MLQIIGWLGCFYMLLRGLNWLGVSRNGERLQTATAVAAIVGALLFAIMFYLQGRGVEANVASYSDTSAGDVQMIGSDPDLNASMTATDDAAMNALAAASRAIENADAAVADADAAIEDLE